MASMMFVNLPVADVRRSREFFRRLGFRFDEMFCDHSTACMVVNDRAMVVLMDRRRFAGLAVAGPLEGPGLRESVVTFAVDERAQVDRIADAAMADGMPLRETEDLGFLYARSFCDPDGHAWEVVWMDPAQIPRTTDR